MRACQRYFGNIDRSKTLHVGDQFLSAGANDYKVCIPPPHFNFFPATAILAFMIVTTQILMSLLGPPRMHNRLDRQPRRDGPAPGRDGRAGGRGGTGKQRETADRACRLALACSTEQLTNVCMHLNMAVSVVVLILDSEYVLFIWYLTTAVNNTRVTDSIRSGRRACHVVVVAYNFDLYYYYCLQHQYIMYKRCYLPRVWGLWTYPIMVSWYPPIASGSHGDKIAVCQDSM